MPLGIAFIEQLGPDDALLVHQESSRVRYPLGPALSFAIPNSVGVNRPAAFIGQ